MPAFWILISIAVVLIWAYFSDGFQEVGEKVKMFFENFKK